MLKLVLALAAFHLSGVAIAAIELPVQIKRYAYTGEHFLYAAHKKEPIFKKLFNEKRLKFVGFKSGKVLKLSQHHLGAKTPIGIDHYQFVLKNEKDLYKFAQIDMPIPPKHPSYGGLEWGLCQAILDYAAEKGDQRLYTIIFDRIPNEKGPSIEASLYSTLRKSTSTFLSSFSKLKSERKPIVARALYSKDLNLDSNMISSQDINSLPNDQLKKMAHEFNSLMTSFSKIK